MNSENHRTILVKTDTVRHFTGLSADAIYERADGNSLFGGYTWVWNVAADPSGEIRDLRFWAREIVAPETVKGWNLDRVIKAILPPKRSQYPAGEIYTTLLSVSRPSLMKLRSELNGQLAANSSFFPREGLEQFLRNRWLGADRATVARRAA